MAKILCSECQDTGWVLKEIDGRSVAVRCRCFYKKQKDSLIERANIPKRYRNCSFDNFEDHDPSQKKALKIARKFSENYPEQDVGLLFIGPCGVGKTHLAVAFIRELMIKKDVFCYFCDFRELIRKIQSSYSPDSDMTENYLLEPIFESDVLVLDELGAKRTTAWVDETVFYIINHRYNSKKLTIFTSNYLDSEGEEEDTRNEYFKKKDDTLVDRIGVRLRSRLYEMCKVVNISGEDYRKIAKQASYRY
jgi:DNA replication protein DnaC